MYKRQVFAVTTPDIGTKGISAFIVEKGWEGFTFGDHYDKLGIRSSSTCQLLFNNVKVPKENLLGKEGDGFKIAMSTLDGGRIGIAAQALGKMCIRDRGWLEPDSAAATREINLSSSIFLSRTITFWTLNTPLVNVPVLSKTTVSTFDSASK